MDHQAYGAHYSPGDSRLHHRNSLIAIGKRKSGEPERECCMRCVEIEQLNSNSPRLLVVSVGASVRLDVREKTRSACVEERLLLVKSLLFSRTEMWCRRTDRHKHRGDLSNFLACNISFVPMEIRRYDDRVSRELQRVPHAPGRPSSIRGISHQDTSFHSHRDVAIEM